MTIKDIDPNEIVKIGTQKGNGYFYVGRMGDLDLDAVNASLRQSLANGYRSAIERIKVRPLKEVTQKFLDGVVKAYKAYKGYEPIENREVVDVFDSIAEDGVKCIIISGDGNGAHWMIDESRKFDILNDSGVMEIYGAAFRLSCNDLQREYERIYKCIDPGMLKSIKKTIEALEDNIEKDLSKISKEPKGIIRMTRMNAVHAICFDEDGNQHADPKIVDKCILKALGRNAEAV